MPDEPEAAAIITALILERPLCVRCLVDRSNLTPATILDTLKGIQGVVGVRRAEDRCRICADLGTTVFIRRPAG